MNITIPGRLLEKLRQDDEWMANIIHLESNISDYFMLSPVFFPDYTIHGIRHIDMVLSIADQLIPGETMEALSGREAAVLVAAILIHDIGMFLTEDGLNKLLDGGRAENRIDHLDRHTWQEDWHAYLQRVKRYTDRELFRAFGESEPIEDVCTDAGQMRRKDYLVCGEFLRQQHHRLAHEIALHGFPGSRDSDIFANTTVSPAERDLIGLIARSHGMAIRETEAYIEATFADATRPNNLAVFYLMAVLRIADYLDAGQHRAPRVLEDRQEIPVPISQQEWRWNQEIDCSSFSWHPEKTSLAVQALPATTTDFVKMEGWLRGVQQELDLSWSIIAEKYIAEGYRLSIHRLESNLLKDATRAALDKRFLTKEARLTANVDLLKLLIHPLYGNDPSFGVRELIQNAVDACNERNYLEGDGGAYHGEVSVEIDTKRNRFTITDNGLGMNEDVLLNYYLAAGSSYRYSKDWMETFASERTAMVTRSGKFGVGVLSSFLLGTSVCVQTRHVRDELGYAFAFSLEQESIDVRRVQCEVGTVIQIELSDEILDRLKKARPSYIGERWYNWYAFKEPSVRYYVDGKEVHKIKEFVPQSGEAVPGWFSYPSPEYESFQWRYRPRRTAHCNGIEIPSMNKYQLGRESGMSMDIPSISVVDKLGRMSIDLSRANILEFPDEAGFLPELYRFFLARLLTVDWDTIEAASANIEDGFFYRTAAGPAGFPYLLSAAGFILRHETFLEAAKVEHFLGIGYRTGGGEDGLNLLQAHIPVTFLPIKKKRASIATYREIVNGSAFSPTYDTTSALLRLWGERKSLDEVRGSLQKFFAANFCEKDTRAGYYRYDARTLPDGPAPLEEQDLCLEHFPVVGEYQLKLRPAPEGRNVMLEIIRECLGDDIWIPYSMKERKKKFPGAFRALEYYMRGESAKHGARVPSAGGKAMCP